MTGAPAASPAASLRVRALRLLADRRLGARLTHLGAVELLDRHGAVDAALDALDLARRPPRPTPGAGRATGEAGAWPASDPAAVASDPGGDVSPAARAAAAARGASRRRAWSIARRTAFLTASAAAAALAFGALGRVAAAVAASHGAPWTLALGTTAALIAAASLRGALDRGRGEWRAAGLAPPTLAALAALLAQRVEECALPAPFGLERLLDGPPLAAAIALAAAASAVGATAWWSAGRERTGSRTPGRSGRPR